MPNDGINAARAALRQIAPRKIFVVCSKRASTEKIVEKILDGYAHHFFFDFSPNPKYEEILAGITVFKSNDCDFILSIGGGSAIDTAKCIKAWAHNDCNSASGALLGQPIIDNGIKHLAIPTTAGTGSEATHFAVVYYNGIKHSVDDASIRPDFVALIPDFLITVPHYQKAATLMDALCQGIESYWCINSTSESRTYARQCIELINSHYIAYFANQPASLTPILLASHLGGEAINISKTTAPHAMSYKLTSLYGYAHGHAVAMCLPLVWQYMQEHLTDCVDRRGEVYLVETFDEIAEMLGCATVSSAIQKFRTICREIGLSIDNAVQHKDLESLCDSVNVDRLTNSPVALDRNAIHNLYSQLLAN